MTHNEFINSFLDSNSSQSAEENVASMFKILLQSEEMVRLRWSGLFTQEIVGLDKGTPAQILEHILNKKWRLMPGDKDFIVMWHRFCFEIQGVQKEMEAYMTVIGDDESNTAMAKTVGLPLAISARLLLQGEIKSRGVVIPVKPEFYDPVLAELSQLGIKLIERIV